MKPPPVVACPESRWVERLLGVPAAGWTYLLLIPAHLFRTNLAFLGMARDAPQWEWALGTLAASAMLLWPGDRPCVRWLGCAVGGFVYGFIAGGIASASPRYLGVPVNTGMACYGPFAAACALCMARLFPYCWADITATRYKSARGREARAAKTSTAVKTSTGGGNG